ncbi:Hypothetical protein BN69_1213 [Methylocystis sp. SC2]|nr:Hypothetical protein BN69_1213 [Methylocystis sp. SC2]
MSRIDDFLPFDYIKNTPEKALPEMTPGDHCIAYTNGDGNFDGSGVVRSRTAMSTKSRRWPRRYSVVRESCKRVASSMRRRIRSSSSALI